MKISFFMPMHPPTATAQEKQSTIRNGKRVFYQNDRLRKGQDKIVDGLIGFIPDEPLKGPLRLSVVWLFEASGKHAHGEWRTTKPDTDNLDKLLKDCMTHLGYWRDDSQVVWQEIKKLWTTDVPGIYVSIETLDDVVKTNDQTVN